MNVRRLAQDAIRQAAGVFARFPWAVATAGAGTLAAMAAVAATHPQEDTWLRLAAAAAVTLPLVVAVTLLSERQPLGPLRRVWPVLAFAAGGGLALWLLQQPDSLPVTESIRLMTLAVLTHLLAAVLPWWRQPGEAGFWRYNQLLFLRFLLASLYAAVLYAGLALALLSIERLLGLDFPDRVYAYLWCLLAGLFHPLFFLGGIPQDWRTLEADRAPPEGLRKFVQFVLVPLTAVYLAILYLYGIRILMTWQLPNGWVGLPVLLLAVVGILAVLLLWPWAARPELPWARRFCRAFFLLAMPLTALLALSIGRRISDYGITEERYLVVLLTLWLAGVTGVRSWKPDLSLRLVPWSLAVLALVAALGGPVGASGWSRRSQQHRVEAILHEAGMIGDAGAPRPSASAEPGIKPPDAASLRSTLYYLERHHGPDALQRWLPDGVADATALIAWLDLPESTATPGWWNISADREALDVDEPATVHLVTLHVEGRQHAVDLGHGWSIFLFKGRIHVEHAAGGSATFPDGGWQPPVPERATEPAETLSAQLSIGSSRVRLLIVYGSGDYRDQRPRFQHVRALVAIPSPSAPSPGLEPPQEAAVWAE